MIAVTVSLVVNPADSAALEAAVGVLARATLAYEPGVKRYSLCRAPNHPGRYLLIELYASQQVLDQHLSTEWYQAAGPTISPLLIEPAVLERYEVLP